MNRTYAAIFRELREKHGYMQKDIVEKMAALGYEVNKHYVSQWETGYNSPSIDQFLGLCRIYNIRDVCKVFAEHDFSDLAYGLNRDGAAKLEEYRQLLVASGMYAPVAQKNKIPPFRRRTAPLYDLGASAGTGQLLDSDSYEMVEVPDVVPDSATFGLHVCGDSMEPTLKDGETIWIQMQPTLSNGEVGVFLLDGEAFVKEYRVSSEGVFLISHNDKYAPRKIGEFNEMKVYGKVVYPIRG